MNRHTHTPTHSVFSLTIQCPERPEIPSIHSVIKSNVRFRRTRMERVRSALATRTERAIISDRLHLDTSQQHHLPPTAIVVSSSNTKTTRTAKYITYTHYILIRNQSHAAGALIIRCRKIRKLVNGRLPLPEMPKRQKTQYTPDPNNTYSTHFIIRRLNDASRTFFSDHHHSVFIWVVAAAVLLSTCRLLGRFGGLVGA